MEKSSCGWLQLLSKQAVSSCNMWCMGGSSSYTWSKQVVKRAGEAKDTESCSF